MGGQVAGPLPGADATPDEQLAATAPHPDLTVVNVRVVGDVAAAERELREVWGGMLCVSSARHTEAELQAIADELIADLGSEAAPERRPLGVTVDGVGERVVVDVVHDEGALQRRMDAEHGPGVVVVESRLRPAT
ncbi:MAG: hypothetical protein WA971_03990 [Microbacterium sp.]